MKKYILLFAAVFVFAYEAKVEPFDEYKIKSPVAGEIVYVKKSLEAQKVNNALAVKIDDKQNLIDLNNSLFQEKILKDEIKNQKEIVTKKRKIYEKYLRLKTKSQTQKDLKFYDYMNSLNQLLNLQNQLSSLKASVFKLKDLINKKNIKLNGYVYKIYVNKGDYAAPGMLLADVYDVSKQKLTIYVPISDVANIKNSDIYINGKKSNYKIYKIWSIPDTKYVTSYKVELVGKGLNFGDIVKVEFKKERE